jgi:hypothetical protein
MQSNVIVLESAFGVHLEADRRNSLYPNTLLRPNSTIPAPASGLYPVIQNEEGATIFGSNVPSASGVSFRSDTSDFVTVGLTDQTYANGVPGVGLLTAVTLKPGASATTPPPTAGTIYIADKSRVGAVVERSAILASGVTLPLKLGNTVTVVLDGGTLRIE